MGRILAIDYGRKRTGLAVTDPLRIIAGALATVETKELEKYLADYFSKNDVDIIVDIFHLVNNEITCPLSFARIKKITLR